jgi:hypothetical protein
MGTLLLVAVAICQGITGYAAFHVSAKGTKARVGFALVTGLGIVCLIIIGVRNDRSQEVIISGIGSIQAELKISAQSPPPPGSPTVGRVAHFQFDQRQIASSNPQLPFSLEITILTDQLIEKPAFAVTCNGPIAEGDAGVGAGLYTMTEKLITDDKRTFAFRWETPPFTPDAPLRIILFSKTAISCNNLIDARTAQFKIRQ